MKKIILLQNCVESQYALTYLNNIIDIVDNIVLDSKYKDLFPKLEKIKYNKKQDKNLLDFGRQLEGKIFISLNGNETMNDDLKQNLNLIIENMTPGTIVQTKCHHNGNLSMNVSYKDFILYDNNNTNFYMDYIYSNDKYNNENKFKLNEKYGMIKTNHFVDYYLSYCKQAAAACRDFIKYDNYREINEKYLGYYKYDKFENIDKNVETEQYENIIKDYFTKYGKETFRRLNLKNLQE